METLTREERSILYDLIVEKYSLLSLALEQYNLTDMTGYSNIIKKTTNEMKVLETIALKFIK